MSHKHTDYRFVLVVWRDSFSYHGWHSIDAINTEMPPMVSCGWLVGESGDSVTITGSIGPDTTVDSPITIPMEAIVYLDDVVLQDVDDQLEVARDPSLSV